MAATDISEVRSTWQSSQYFYQQIYGKYNVASIDIDIWTGRFETRDEKGFGIIKRSQRKKTNQCDKKGVKRVPMMKPTDSEQMAGVEIPL